MKGLDKMLKPMLNMLEIMVPDSLPENDASEFMVELIDTYIPEELPKDLIRKFATDMINKNPEEFEEKLRDLNIKMLHYFNRKKE